MTTKSILTIALLISLSFKGICQETVFKLLVNDVKLADEYFQEGNFQGALNLYLNEANKRRHAKDISLKIGRCYYFLKQYDKSIASYNKDSLSLNLSDIHQYAEAQTALGNYKQAIISYKKYHAKRPDDMLAMQKIWSLSNIQFFYEDSAYYDIHLLPINTNYGEFCSVPYDNGIVFVSNRKDIGWVEHIDASLDLPFYKLYYAEAKSDSLFQTDTLKVAPWLTYNNVKVFNRQFGFKFHVGSVAFYQQAEKMVLTAADEENGKNNRKTLQLYFAEKHKGFWKITERFPYNSPDYSNSDPTISEDGSTLYFSSDMKGGLGGKDIYMSSFIDGKWTRPINLKEPVNTPYDEVFPHLSDKRTLYFSSNGHPGLGGLDIFKSEIYADHYGEIQNLGYPLNSKADDYGIFIDSLYTHGYITSNRMDGGFDDNIYEFTMDMQSYPLQISGVIKYIEHNWMDSSQIKVLPKVKILLIDNKRNITVSENNSDSLGNFQITVPYSSKYKIRVIGDEIGEGIISFDIPEHQKLNDKFEIVVVKDDFKTSENELK